MNEQFDVSAQAKRKLRFTKSNDELKPSDSDTKKYLDERGLSTDPIDLAYISLNDPDTVIYINDGYVGLDQLLPESDFWRFIVFLDLKKRGYRVRVLRGSPIDLAVWEKKKDAINERPRYIIKIVNEGRGETVRSIIDLIKYSENNGMQLVLALISSDGILTYYKAFTFKPMNPNL
ncbi:MAG: endonuclease [Thermocladium sp.]